MKFFKLHIHYIFLLGLIFIINQNLQAQKLTEEYCVKHFNLDKGVAIEGYDVVSYFVENKPQKGKPSISARYLGVIYRFATKEHRDLFIKNPQKYMPQYGGWCAYAMGAKNEKVTMNPENYKIVDGKLYLFYKNFFTDTLEDWNEDEENLKKKANENWSEVK
ncbi:YHS domain-containing (seleno)protein [Bernardetia sp.]|uniref:YHS domain-containing (seleno)protein n=1 Tax=Bernardetia sp. TaxID=1937974 RepID=UPI0025B89175|nr:YHS domain-containing (seleno)protein [Bernardetia sp.]